MTFHSNSQRNLVRGCYPYSSGCEIRFRGRYRGREVSISQPIAQKNVYHLSTSKFKLRFLSLLRRLYKTQAADTFKQGNKINH